MLALMQSCVLYQNSTSDVTLLDIPRSIEQAQGAFPNRFISSSPMEQPKRGQGRHGPWLLPRIIEEDPRQIASERKRKRLDPTERSSSSYSSAQQEQHTEHKPVDVGDAPNGTIFYHNSYSTCLNMVVRNDHAKIPPRSTVLQGSIASTLEIFTSTAPPFDFIVLDPPWPNRSARRKKSYGIAYGMNDIKTLLSLLPIQPSLSKEGFVAVWVTNKTAFRDMLLEKGGFFENWGIRLFEEWIWLKITSGGEPICPLNSKWRKPYEVLLIGRRIVNEDMTEGPEVKRRVLIAVPDLHSRKPNIGSLIEQVTGRVEGTYEALEIFARNLTAGWWGWGDEALKFQMSKNWQETEH
jgi:N6-adenosine-specific RNA methylase IME4